MAHTLVILILPLGKEQRKCKLEKYVDVYCARVCVMCTVSVVNCTSG